MIDTNREKLHYAVIDLETRNVEALVSFNGIATSQNYYRLDQDGFSKIKTLMFDKHLGVNISESGVITTYVMPLPPPPPLKDQATAAMKDIQSQAPMIVAMGESFGPRTQACVKALQAIIDGTDTASTELPARPDKLTD